MLCTRRLMGSTDQTDPSCFYFRISWILMERLWFYFFCPLNLLQGLRSLKNWLLKKFSMNILDRTFWTKNLNSSLKNGYFGAIIFQEIEFYEHLKCNFKTSWPQKISINKKHFAAKITLILMIKKMPLTFLDVEK